MLLWLKIYIIWIPELETLKPILHVFTMQAIHAMYYCAKTNLQLVFSFTPIKGRLELSRTTPCQLMSINKLVWPLKLLQGIGLGTKYVQ